MNIVPYVRKTLILISAALAFNAGFVGAHSDDYFDSRPSPHGGQVRMSGPYHFELVIAEKTIVIYVTDHADQPIATTGAAAKLEVSVGGKKTLVELVPVGHNNFESAWSIAIAPDLIVRLSAKFPNQPAQKAKFTPFAKNK